jgi:branched-chain amino acid transport system substrate-binding protein
MQYLDKTNPDAKLAILYQNDDFGKAYLAAIEKYLEANDSKVTVAEAKSYDPSAGQTTEGVTTELAQTKADVFFVGIGGTPCPQTLGFIPSDWKPLTYVSIPCSGKLALSLAGGKDEGVYSAQATYDPDNPEDKSQPAVAEYIDATTKQGLSEIQIYGGIVSAGWGFGAMLGAGLENAETVDRAGLMNAMYALDGSEVGLARKGVVAHTDGADDPWALEQLRMVQRKGGQWNEVEALVDYDGQSNEFAG